VYHKSKIILTFVLTFFLKNIIFSQEIKVHRIDPPNWWAGMKNEQLQLLVKGENMNDCNVKINYPGIQIKKITAAENPEYIFIDLTISTAAKSGKFNITFQSKKNKELIVFPYELKQRDNTAVKKKGINSSDFIYLLITDRFCNGDTSNDFIPSMQEKYFSRDSLMSRHGGDLQGVTNKLDYLKNLGVTALWTSPFFENDQPMASYHGYAVTDHYKTDSRFGTNEIYKDFVGKAHEKGMKVIMDLVFNHVGSNHVHIKNPPFKSWVHHWDAFTMSNFRDVTNMDPYVSDADKKKFSEGWFDKHMPDLNQDDAFLANYLIQNTIWWIEYAGLDGIRLDTYAYPSQKFMTDWTNAVLKEYPQIGIFAETWVSGLANQAFYTKNTGLKNPNNPTLPGVTDFQLHYAINNALNNNFGWTEGVAALYYCLANDFLYEDPYRNVVFLDNHDVSRFYSVVGEDLEKFKMGTGFLLTTRGIPCLYYGTEILMKNFADKHENVRFDFSGGWKADKVNKFEKSNLNEKEKSAFEWIQKLAQYRQKTTALQTGKLKQFVPENGVYVYFRYDEQKTIMIVMNQNKESYLLNTKRFHEIIKNNATAIDVINDKKIKLNESLEVSAKCIMILELEK